MSGRAAVGGDRWTLTLEVLKIDRKTGSEGRD